MTSNIINRPNRADQYLISATLDGKDLGIWDKMSGGERDSEETKYPPGGLGEPIPLGGRATTGNVTISRIYDLDRDHSQIKTWYGRVGKGWMVITKQPLDADGNAFGSPLTYSGKLKAVTAPEPDSESSDAAMVALECSTSGTIG